MSLRWVDRTPGDRVDTQNGTDVSFRVRGFVVSMRSEWFLITSGHVLKEIEQDLLAGHKLEEWTLEVEDHPGAASHVLIPFAFAEAEKRSWSDRGEGDYGFVHLKSEYPPLLETNGIVAMDERAWRISGDF